ncbi:MAG: hypothetical protein IJX57_03565 [Clostridia bacterium]|nr:hypothetical protein [Clostridia bacterium]
MCKECFLCGRNGNGDRLERHHIFSGVNRKWSEKYGLVVDLCGERCHRNGEFSAHRNAEVAAYLHRYGQEKAMKEQGWTVEQFRDRFGKSYI